MSYVIIIGTDLGITVHGTFATEESADRTVARWRKAFDRQYGERTAKPEVWSQPLLGKSAGTRDRIWGRKAPS